MCIIYGQALAWLVGSASVQCMQESCFFLNISPGCTGKVVAGIFRSYEKQLHETGNWSKTSIVVHHVCLEAALHARWLGEHLISGQQMLLCMSAPPGAFVLLLLGV